MELERFGKDFFVALFDEIVKRFKWVLAFFILSVAAGGAVYGYKYYRSGVEQQAHKAFLECMNYFDAPIGEAQKEIDIFGIEKVSFATTDEKWSKVAEVFKKAYATNSSSGIAPLFLNFQAEAFIKQNKLIDAIALQKKAVVELRDPHLKSVYSIKLSLMQLDSGDHVVRQNGFDLLKSIAEDSKSVVHDFALYHIGLHFWHEKDFALAKNYWNQLVLAYGQDSKHPSPWAAQAREKLKLIASL